MKQYNFKGLKRVTKTTAKKLYNAGLDVLFIPCNLSPVSPWGLGIWQNINLLGQYDSFEKLCNYYEFYNCMDAETGKYIAFYIKEEV